MARAPQLQPDRRLPGTGDAAMAQSLAARLPRLVLESRRVSATLAHGLHGRRRAGSGETFWQFRPFVAGEAAGRIDWRRSGRDDRLYVREREEEAPHAIHFWIDRSASMAYRSDLAGAPKVERAIVLGLALADALVDGGERVSLLGRTRPSASRRIIERLIESLAAGTDLDDDLPPGIRIGRLDEVILLGDFLSPLPDVERRVAELSSGGARGHLVVVIDPVEETFPFAGQAVLHESEGGLSLRVGDAAAWGRDYRARITKHRAGIADLCRRRGWTCTVHHTDRPASEAALRVMTLLAGAARHRSAA